MKPGSASAHVNAARTRPRLIGGARRLYTTGGRVGAYMERVSERIWRRSHESFIC